MAMMRTKRLAYGNLPGPALGEGESLPAPRAAVVYTVPVGFRGIVRDVRLTATAPVGTGLAAIYADTPEGLVTLLLADLAHDIPTYLGASCDVVLEAGDSLQVGHPYSELQFYISGAEVPLLPAP